MVDVSKFNSDESRRSVLKKGALATAGAGIVSGGIGSAVAQEDGGDDTEASGQKALIFQNNFRPFARFSFVSDVIDWVPNVEEVSNNVWSNYNVRMIRYLNTGEQVPFFVAQDAQIGQYDDQLGFVVDDDDDASQPQVYEMDKNFALFGDSPHIVTVNFSPVGEEEEDDLLDNEDWWQGTGAVGEGTTTPTGDTTGDNATGGNQSS